MNETEHFASEQKTEVDRKAVKQLRSIAKGKFTRKLGKFYQHVKEKAPLEILENSYNLVSKAFEEVEAVNDRYCSILDEVEDCKVLEESNIYIQDLEDKKCSAHVDFVKLKDKLQVKTNIKVKSIDVPKFGGDIRDYSNFKRDYVRLMIPNYGQDPFALKQCIYGDALDIIRGVDHDFDKMFERMDAFYGNSRRVVDVVIEDLRTLEPIPEGDSVRLINMVNKIEQCFLYLDQLDLSDELNTANMTSQVEKLLPSTQKREWVKIAEKTPTCDLFKTLLEYLISEKKSLQYLNADIRNDSKVKGRVNHTAGVANEYNSDCNKYPDLTKRISDLEIALTKITNIVTKIADGTKEEKHKFVNSGMRLKKCWYHDTDGHDILDCKTFQGLSNHDKVEQVKKWNICFNCLKGTHVARRCFKASRCTAINDNNQVCGKAHHTILHKTNLETNSYISSRSNGVLFMVNRIRCGHHTLNALFDSGADVTMIRNGAALDLGLKGKNTCLAVTKLGGKTVTFDSKEYDLVLSDKYGNDVNITAYGIDEITSHIDKVDLSNIKALFTSINICDLDRPHGRIDILIGTDHCTLFPTVKETVNDNLQLMESRFGMCVRGSHPSIPRRSTFNNAMGIRINHVSGINFDDEITVEARNDIKTHIDEFFNIEHLGTECKPKCGNCKCGKCAIGNNNYSIKDERELALIEKGLVYDSENKQWYANFPWIKDPNLLYNNVSAAIKRMKGTEKRLLKLGEEYAKAYDNQILDMTSRGVARKLYSDELENYSGPVTYIQHHEVLKPGSTSTPLRIVFDSSAKYMSQSLNEFWAKGPDILNSMIGILLRFREQPIGITGDISKMYNCIKLPELEQHVHRFVWRNLDMNRKPDHYVLTSMGFGDKPSGIIAMLALKHTAEQWMHQYPEAARMIISNAYVDDIIHSVENEEKAKILINEAEKILSSGNFKIKEWVLTNVNSEDEQYTSEEYVKVLGLNWKKKTDGFSFKIKLNFSPKYKGIRMGSDLNLTNFHDNIPTILTKRDVVSQMCSSVYDPIGLLLPFTLKAKILLRKTVNCENKLGWDDPLSCNLRDEWISHFHSLFSIESLTFTRCVKPESAIGFPTLVIFSDGSLNAYGAVAYVRWELKSGSFESRLLIAKNRVAPTRQLSIPRLELCGAVISCRLRKVIEEEMSYKFNTVLHITDSSIVRGQIQKESYGFGTFVATRVAEIQSKSNPNEWWWIATDQNPADLLTRPNNSNDKFILSIWEYGPKFMSQPIEKWPISQYNECNLPDRVNVNMTLQVKPIDSIIDISKFQSYTKLLAVTCRVLNIVKVKSFKGVGMEVVPETIEEAEYYWIKHAQSSIPEHWNTIYQRLGPFQCDGIIKVGQRIQNWLKENWNQDTFILLPKDHPFTMLYIKHLHNIDHAGVDVTLCKLQSKFWVPSARKIIKMVKRSCVICRKLDATVTGQSMGQIADERMKPCPAFYHTATDLFGPFQIRDNVKKRTIGKCYGVVFNCVTTRAVYIDVVDGYDTESFLKTLRRFISIHGYPSTIHSDLGTQLVSASKELKNAIEKWNLSEISEFGGQQGLQWKFNQSADAPWQNGISEALIKSIKRSLVMILGPSVITFSELQTIFFEIANMMNERPIGMKPGMDIESGTYLCPNDLLLGRASSHVPSGTWAIDGNFKKRLDFIENVVNTFWRKWQRDYFPTLIIRQKWHTEKRNVQIGDIVLVQDANNVRGKWRMGEVKDVEIGRDGKVRDVSIRYKTQKPGKDYKGKGSAIIKRSVHKIVVLLPLEEQ